jgi:hypothetical protein
VADDVLSVGHALTHTALNIPLPLIDVNGKYLYLYSVKSRAAGTTIAFPNLPSLSVGVVNGPATHGVPCGQA